MAILLIKKTQTICCGAVRLFSFASPVMLAGLKIYTAVKVMNSLVSGMLSVGYGGLFGLLTLRCG